MTYVYCPHRSNGAFELVKALGAYRLRTFDGMDFWDKRKRYELRDGDIIVCWGASVPDIEGIRVLNSLDQPFTAFTEWERLSGFGIPVVGLGSGTPPKYTLVPRLQRQLFEINPKFYIQRETFVNEYRIHSFDKRSIRAGVKVPRDGFIPCPEKEWRADAGLFHPWVRSFEGGWRVSYDGFKSTSDLRKLAHKAVTALGLTFGAVDIGVQDDGRLKVLEVDKAPRIEGGTIASYTRAITRWIREGSGQGGSSDIGGVSAGEPAQIGYDDGEDPGDL